MFGLSVRFTLKDEASAGGFDALVAQTLPHIRESEPGTLVYAVHQVDGKPLERIFYELYRDRAAFDAHEDQPHVKRFLAKREAFLSSVEVDFLHLANAKGVSE
ncbi:antibiotic biosynthesis monooxygenase [Nocardiopsis sp. CNR-923]|uniref:putative quinol monooxygenase n=1 Tax=Nocardiopsis sp. CNR-923 TaxID=1904965 RepID=UPI000964E02D|nr:antibiotic biosynthesis monooxygenase [Nocardiopsis sp. CNR-923]OLT29503.1 antibiotic biosynthesis monooxygenase [Nocardiopsis sp. CNR-923]